MGKRCAVLTVVAALACWGPAGALPQAEELTLIVNCKPPSFKTRRPVMVLTGSCPLPDGVILKINLSRVIENLQGGQLLQTYSGAGSGTEGLEGKKFTYDTPIDGPGKFQVSVMLPVDMQERQHYDEVKKKTANKHTWQFEFLVWGDELVSQLSPKLTELQSVIAETRELLKRFEAACQNEQVWAAQQKPLVAEANKLRAKLEGHELKAFYPAAVNNLFYTVRNVVTNAPYYTFSDGKFSGAKDYHADSKKVSTYRNEDFSWENLKRYVEESLPCSGREFSLWIVKDLRRTGGAMRPDILEAVKAQIKAPGVDFFAERLQKATITDLDPLEAEIRGTAAKK
jgi:hypothetical protein